MLAALLAIGASGDRFSGFFGMGVKDSVACLDALPGVLVVASCALDDRGVCGGVY